jgi:Glutathione peroxidase
MLCVSSAFSFFAGKTRAGALSLSSLSMKSFYDITEKDASGNTVNFSKFKGKVVYGVNVASKVRSHFSPIEVSSIIHNQHLVTRH